MRLNKYITLIILLLISYESFPQNYNSTNSPNNKKNWVFTFGSGIQMSGIKSEDFIRSNIAPVFNINIGKWVTPEVALQIGYKGFYFHTIADDSKHHYNFFYGEVLLNVNELFNGSEINKNKWNVIFHPGAGYFYNNFYNRPNICANIGIANKIEVLNHLEVFLDISAIMGWDIYQGNEDILPSCVLGLIYSL